MNADEAYHKATERIQKDIKQAERAIRTAISQGKLECDVTYTRETPHVLNHLTNLGYNVRPYSQYKAARVVHVVAIGWSHLASKGNVAEAQRMKK